jgi:hypothetical protein
MLREYWGIGKPGLAWALLDTCEENKDLIDKYMEKYPCTSEYSNTFGRTLVAVTFEMPVAQIPSSFKRVD